MHDGNDAPAIAEFGMPGGERVILRPIRPDDAPRLQALAPRLSNETIHFRFFGGRRVLRPEEADRLATVDHRTREAIVAERSTPSGPELIGVARYDERAGALLPTAEFAIVVEDSQQRGGLGRALLFALVAAARRNGYQHLDGDMLADNEPMRRFVRGAGYPVTFRPEGTELHFSWLIAAPPTGQR